MTCKVLQVVSFSHILKNFTQYHFWLTKFECKYTVTIAIQKGKTGEKWWSENDKGKTGEKSRYQKSKIFAS